MITYSRTQGTRINKSYNVSVSDQLLRERGYEQMPTSLTGKNQLQISLQDSCQQRATQRTKGFT